MDLSPYEIWCNKEWGYFSVSKSYTIKQILDFYAIFPWKMDIMGDMEERRGLLKQMLRFFEHINLFDVKLLQGIVCIRTRWDLGWWLVMLLFSPQPKSKPELLRIWLKPGPKFRPRHELNLRSSPGFWQQDNSAELNPSGNHIIIGEFKVGGYAS